MPLTTAARAAAAAPAGKVADAVDPLLAPYDLAAGAGGSGDLSFLFGGSSDDGTGLAVRGEGRGEVAEGRGPGQ